MMPSEYEMLLETTAREMFIRSASIGPMNSEFTPDGLRRHFETLAVGAYRAAEIFVAETAKRRQIWADEDAARIPGSKLGPLMQRATR